MGPAAADILQTQCRHLKDTDRQVGLFKCQHQDSTSREVQLDGVNLCAAVPDRKSRYPPQVRHHYSKDHQGPGFIHGAPKAWYDAELGCRIIPASVQTEGSRDGGGKKCKL